MDTPLELLETEVLPEWLDYNEHMNVAYYVMVFDQAVDELLNRVGLGKDYTRAGRGSVFAIQNHIHYLREVKAGAKLAVNLQLLELDAKRLLMFFRMRDAADGQAVATSELLGIHVGAGRRAVRFPERQFKALQELMEKQAGLPRPKLAGHRISTSMKH